MNFSVLSLVLASCLPQNSTAASPQTYTAALPQTYTAALPQTATAKNADTKTESIELFRFKDVSAAPRWQAVNDGVMGGRSDGRFRITEQGTLLFFGNLSLANNGGFASVRSRGQQLGLQTGDEIVIRVKGDGRKYALNLYTPDRRMAFSYRLEFATLDGKWSESRLPLKQFVATSFGRTMPSMVLNPTRVSGIGILLGDKKPGAFQLEIQSIKVSRATDVK
ncbi:MAG: CIA30 family protein [Fuerstiella sp.]